MTIAFIILSHKLPKQLGRLVKALQNDDHWFFIHIDRKTSDADVALMHTVTAGVPNVCYLERTSCEWGGFGIVRATLIGIRALLASKVNFDYAVLQSGQQYPIKSNEYIRETLRNADGRSFIDHQCFPVSPWPDGGYSRIEKWHLQLVKRTYAFPSPGARNALLNLLFRKRTFPVNYWPYAGSQFWLLHRQAIEYIDKFVEKNHDFVRFFHHVRIPDEIFFHTILLNSPLSETIINNHLHLIRWPGPKIWTAQDMDELSASPALFARKFDMNVDETVLDLIDEKLRLKGLSKKAAVG
jgi:hypothetical protein